MCVAAVAMSGLVKIEQHLERRMQRALLHDHRVDHGCHLCERQRPNRPRLSRDVSAHACRCRLTMCLLEHDSARCVSRVACSAT